MYGVDGDKEKCDQRYKKKVKNFQKCEKFEKSVEKTMDGVDGDNEKCD